MKWRFINTGHHSGVLNMETDARLANTSGAGIPILRLYGWNPTAISIGKNQRFEDFDLEKLEAAGIDIVRRPTGGRAILHADELTYSTVMPAGNRNLRQVYQFVNEGLLAGLRLMGVPAEFAAAADDFRTSHNSIPCFTTSAKCEIHCFGKKILGSAQRRFGDTVLQHGSLLLGPRHREIVNYLSPSALNTAGPMLDELDLHAADLHTLLGRPIGFEEAAACIREGFVREHGIEFSEADVLIQEYTEALP